MLLRLMKRLSAAINTPLPKAIMVAIIDFGKLTNNATSEPKRSGTLAIKPQTRDSKTDAILLNYYYCYCKNIK